MGSYRGRIDIIADILRVAEARAKKTQIMYRANLSYTILQRYLAELTEASLIAYEDDAQYYTLTDRGREYLVLYKDYSKANRHIEKRLNSAKVKRKVLDKYCVTNRWKSRAAHKATSVALKNKTEKNECFS